VLFKNSYKNYAVLVFVIFSRKPRTQEKGVIMAEVMTHPHEESRWTRLTMASSSAVEGLAGAGAIVLSILGLAGLFPSFLLGIAVIVIGGALIMEGGAVAARLSYALREASEGKIELAELGGGVSLEFLGGAAGIALAIIGLAGVVPMILWPIAAIVYGAAHLFGSTITAHIRTYKYLGQPEHVQNVANQAVRAAADVQGLIGIGGITLGILALIGFAPLTLTLITMLAFGFADLLRGPSIAARAFSRF
jgi:hypothetical protein